MLQGMIRAAMAALVFAIAILVYINYFHRSDSGLTDHSELATAPEVPKVPSNPDAVSAAQNAITNQDASSDAGTKLQRAEILDNGGELADVVDLPPAPRMRPSNLTAPAQAAAPKATGKRTHIVQPGESLWSISKKYLGNGELNAKIADCNGLTSKDRIRAGQVLVIPDGSQPAVAQTPVRPAPLVRAPVEAAHSAEDLADDDDARRVTRTSRNNDHGSPSIMSTTVPNKY
ncbi:MAG: LysM domain-containing protein [Planctomycetota bacterium]